MDTIWWIVIAVAVALVVLAVLAWGVAQSTAQRGATRKLRARVRPDRRLDRLAAGGRARARRAETESRRARHPASLRGRTGALHGRLAACRERFVDDPELAAREADSIVRNVLDEEGYPDDDFDARSAAVSVDHPDVVERYRHGHEMVHGNGAQGEERTENLRKAMVDFRAVFEQLVEPVSEPDLSAQR